MHTHPSQPHMEGMAGRQAMEQAGSNTWLPIHTAVHPSSFPAAPAQPHAPHLRPLRRLRQPLALRPNQHAAGIRVWLRLAHGLLRHLCRPLQLAQVQGCM